MEFLPNGECLIDICAGGCAVTHAALECIKNTPPMLPPKWNRVIANDIQPMIVELFRNAVQGKYRNETRWISREDFFRLRETDPYVKYIWSFGNNGKDYLYGKSIEPYKKALHYAYVHGDFELLEAMVGKVPHDDTKQYLRTHGNEIRAAIGVKLRENRTSGMEELQSLESLERLQSLERLEISSKSYDEVEIPLDSVIYADIPYEGTKCDSYKSFNHQRFYDWAAQQDNIFISSYAISDPRFKVAFEIEKTVLSNNNGTNGRAIERIYTRR